jgi:hypothetical protein
MRLFALVLVIGATASASFAVGTVNDPPTFVPWKKIGDIGLGMYKSRVQYEYGGDRDGFHLIQSLGPMYSNGEQGYYVLHGTHVIVAFYGNRVGEIGWSTPYYRTSSGFGAGSAIPLGACHKTATNPCEYRWNGFVFNSWFKGPCNCWVRERPKQHEWFYIYTRQGRVTSFYLATRYPG